VAFFNQADDLRVFPMQDSSTVVDTIARHAFLSRRSSTVCSATTSFRSGLRGADPSPRQRLRHVPCRPLGAASLLPCLHEGFGPFAVNALRDALTAAQLSDAILAPQPVQHDPDLLAMAFACSSCLAHVPLVLSITWLLCETGAVVLHHIYAGRRRGSDRFPLGRN
jgi:hypothetical protein